MNKEKFGKDLNKIKIFEINFDLLSVFFCCFKNLG